MKRLFAVVVVFLLAGSALVVRRYRGTRLVSPYDLAARSVEENAAEGKRAGLTPVMVGPLRALIRRPITGHAWLLYWGGNTDTYFKEAVETVTGLALPPELGVLVVAPPGYDSPGHPSPAQLERDAVMTRDWLRANEHAERIVTGGFSMGIYSALVAAEKDVVATVVMGNAPVFEAGEPGRLIRLRVPDYYRVRDAPPKVPALVIQGELDEPQLGREVAAWLGARMLVLPGVDHVSTQRDPTGLREMSSFVQKALQN